MILVDSDSQPASVGDGNMRKICGKYAENMLLQPVVLKQINFATHPFGTVQIRFSSILFNEKYFVKRIREVCLKEVCEKVWGKNGKDNRGVITMQGRL